MTERLHGVTLAIAIGMLSHGLWRIDPAAMFIGTGIVLLVLLGCARNPRNRQHGRSN